MSPHALLFLLLFLVVLVLVSAVAGIIGFALARWDGATIPVSVTRGGLVFAGTLTVGIALMAALLPELTQSPRP